VSAFCLITWIEFSEAWAKRPGGKTTSNITQPGNTQGSPGASSSNSAQTTNKRTGGDKQKYMEIKMQEVFITN
jgi:hypothetical protein